MGFAQNSFLAHFALRHEIGEIFSQDVKLILFCVEQWQMINCEFQFFKKQTC